MCLPYQVLIKENTQDLSAPATLMEGLKRQQGEALAKYRDQLIASVRNQRQAATEELWDLEQRERKRIDEFLEDQTAQLEAASNRLEEYDRNYPTNVGQNAQVYFKVT